MIKLAPIGLWLPVIIGAALGSLVFTVTATLLMLHLARALPSTSQQIAFESNRDGNWEIYRLDISTGILQNLTRSRSDDRAPGWSANGRQIVFYADRDGDLDTEIYMMGADGGQVQRLETSGSNTWRPLLSPDGRYLLYILGYGRIRLRALNGQSDRQLTFGFGPSWSPDSRYVAYYVNPDSTLSGEIQVIDIHQNTSRNLTNHPAHDWSPAWSPDGRYLAFASTRDGNAEIYVMDVRCLPEPRCAPDIRRLTYSRTQDRYPTWSPDSTQIVFEGERSGHIQLYIVNADGSGLRPLTVSSGNDQFPSWSPRRY